MTNSPNDLIERILRLAATDANFRERLLTDPHAASQQIAPGAIAPNAKIKFIEKPPGIDALYVLPALASRSGLADSELEAIAGGIGDTCQMEPDTCWSTCPSTCVETCPSGLTEVGP